MITKNLKIIVDQLNSEEVKSFYNLWLANEKDFNLIMKEAVEAVGTITCKGLTKMLIYNDRRMRERERQTERERQRERE
jgi:hypothetical protein